MLKSNSATTKFLFNNFYDKYYDLIHIMANVIKWNITLYDGEVNIESYKDAFLPFAIRRLQVVIS